MSHLIDVQQNIGEFHYQMKRYRECVEQLEKVVELSTENILAHRLLGECYLEAKRFLDALRAFKMVLF